MMRLCMFSYNSFFTITNCYYVSLTTTKTVVSWWQTRRLSSPSPTPSIWSCSAPTWTATLTWSAPTSWSGDPFWPFPAASRQSPLSSWAQEPRAESRPESSTSASSWYLTWKKVFARTFSVCDFYIFDYQKKLEYYSLFLSFWWVSHPSFWPVTLLGFAHKLS